MSMSHLLIDLGRILLGLVFAIAAIIDFRCREALLGMLNNKKVPSANLLLHAAIILKLVAGLLIVFNLLTLIASAALAVFTIIANIVFHDFWHFEGQKREIEFVHFLSHLGLVAGFILIIGVMVSS